MLLLDFGSNVRMENYKNEHNVSLQSNTYKKLLFEKIK